MGLHATLADLTIVRPLFETSFRVFLSIWEEAARYFRGRNELLFAGGKPFFGKLEKQNALQFPRGTVEKEREKLCYYASFEANKPR